MVCVEGEDEEKWTTKEAAPADSLLEQRYRRCRQQRVFFPLVDPPTSPSPSSPLLPLSFPSHCLWSARSNPLSKMLDWLYTLLHLSLARLRPLFVRTSFLILLLPDLQNLVFCCLIWRAAGGCLSSTHNTYSLLVRQRCWSAVWGGSLVSHLGASRSSCYGSSVDDELLGTQLRGSLTSCR